MPQPLSWIGMRVDDAYGARIGVVNDVYLESDGSPRWIFVLRRRVLIPARDAIAGAGRVWVPFSLDLIESAPKVWSLDDVTLEFETATRRWYATHKDHSGWATHVRP